MTNQSQFPYNFGDRASYKIAAAQWKADYAELSQKIRESRKASRAAESLYSKQSTSENGNAFYKAFSTWRNNKTQARQLIDVRHAMKKEAQRQYKETACSTA